MTFVYIVRCRFTEPAREPGWNAWYSGPKIAQMLAKPHFASCQRFQRTAGNGRDYLALWTVRSPEAFQSSEYTGGWGWFEWRPFITDWSRDLFDAGNRPEAAFAVPERGLLDVVAFDGMSADEAQAAAARDPTTMMWLPVVGLDRHTPMIGLRIVGNGNSPPPDSGPGRRASYRPICRFFTAAAARPAEPAP